MSAALLCILLSAPYTRAVPPSSPPAAVRALAAKRRAPASPTAPAQGRLLIASRTLSDSNFAETVILLLSYDNGRGAMGIVVNRPTDVPLATALPDVKELRDRSERLFLGGPVSAHLMLLLIRSHSHPKAAQTVFADVYASGSIAVLRHALASATKTDRWRAYAGYAGWGPGQLENEIARGDWHVAPADATTLFDTPPAEMWPKLIARFSGEWTRRAAPTTCQSGSATLQVALQMSTRSPSDVASGRELYAGLQLKTSRTPLP